jgi:hypothetical protein
MSLISIANFSVYSLYLRCQGTKIATSQYFPTVSKFPLQNFSQLASQILKHNSRLVGANVLITCLLRFLIIYLKSRLQFYAKVNLSHSTRRLYWYSAVAIT